MWLAATTRVVESRGQVSDEGFWLLSHKLLAGGSYECNESDDAVAEGSKGVHMIQNSTRRLEQFPQERNVVICVDIATEETKEAQQFVAVDAVWAIVRENKEELLESEG